MGRRALKQYCAAFSLYCPNYRQRAARVRINMVEQDHDEASSETVSEERAIVPQLVPANVVDQLISPLDDGACVAVVANNNLPLLSQAKTPPGVVVATQQSVVEVQTTRASAGSDVWALYSKILPNVSCSLERSLSL
jgi:hypothetical protein